MTARRSETRAMFYLNKPEWDADHPFQKSSGLPVKDYDAGDTYNFIKLIQDTTQTKITSDPVDLRKVPDELKDKVKYEVFGWPADGGMPKLLGWLSSKPNCWAYALGQIRKFESSEVRGDK